MGEEKDHPLQLVLVHIGCGGCGGGGGGGEGGWEGREEGGEGVQETDQHWSMLVAALAESRKLQQGPGKKEKCGREKGKVYWIVQELSVCTRHFLPLFVEEVWLV